MDDALVALEADEHGHADQDQSVDERRQHAGALVPERLPMVGRPALEVEGYPGQDERGDVAEVMPPVADERQAVSDRARYKLGCH